MTTSATHYHFLSGICRAARFSNGGLEREALLGDYNEIIAEIRAFKRDEATKKLENLHSSANLTINEPQIAKIQKGCYSASEKLDSIFYNLTLQKTII